MNSSMISPNYLQSRSSKLETLSLSLAYAFTFSPNRTSLCFPLSSCNGSPTFLPRAPFISRRCNAATSRKKRMVMSQSSDDVTSTSAEHANAVIEDPQDSQRNQLVASSTKPIPIWLFVVENAVQATILALAIVGSVHTRRRALTHLVAILSVPQFILILNRIWRRIRSSAFAGSTFAGSSLSSDEKAPFNADSDSSEAAVDQERFGGELTIAQSKMVSTSIRSAVAEEVSSLRYAIEQIEQTTEQRQEARNLAIAEAIASLDGNLRALRRSVDTRRQVQDSAPFALVSELEIVKSRLKQAEKDKTELEVRLRAAEDNFEEAKRHGERARREADEASSTELTLRTELAVASSRLLRLEEVTERLDRAERRNDELQEQVLNGNREQEGLRQSAEDAERRVLRVENIAQLLRDKVQELTGKPLPRYGQDDDDGLGAKKEDTNNQFWPKRLRGKADLRPDSVVYQELLREQKKSNSPEWPHDPLGIERQRQEAGQRKMLPDDGGFGTGDSISENNNNSNESLSNNKLLSSEGAPDVMFSFSRGEFDESNSPRTVEESSLEPADSALSPESSEKPDKRESQQSAESTASFVEILQQQASSSDNSFLSPQEEVPPISESSVAMAENKKNKASSFSEQPETEEETFAQTEESNPREETEISEELSDDSVQEKLSRLSEKKVDGTATRLGESEPNEEIAFQNQTQVEHNPATEVAEQSGKAFQESEAAPEIDSGPKEDRFNHENELSIPRDTKNYSGLQRSSDLEGVTEGGNSSVQDSEQTSTGGISEEKVDSSQGTASYLESLSRNEEEEPVETVEDLVKSAQELVRKARVRGLAVKQADLLFEKATKKLERALQGVDNRTDVEAELGGCLLAWAKTNVANPNARNRLSRALELLKSSVESRPDDETILFNTGLCLCLVASTSTEQKALEFYQMACDTYERLIQLNFNSRIACFNCGLAYVSLGRLSLVNGRGADVNRCFERASILFERSLELKPGDGKAISYLDDCKRQLKVLD